MGDEHDLDYWRERALIAEAEYRILQQIADGVPASSEVRDEDFWRAGGAFRWCWPRLNVYRPADRRVRAALNRYPHNVIGACVVAFGWCWGVQWKSTPRPLSSTQNPKADD